MDLTRTYRVECEKQRRGETDRPRQGEALAETKIKHGHHTVEYDVDQMVADRVESPQPVVPAEGEDREGTVGLVTLLLGHGRAPEVVLEESGPGDVGPEVLVLLDGGHVVENEITGERVPVEDHAQQKETSLDQVHAIEGNNPAAGAAISGSKELGLGDSGGSSFRRTAVRLYRRRRTAIIVVVIRPFTTLASSAAAAAAFEAIGGSGCQHRG